jgi:hypothetical protein
MNLGSGEHTSRYCMAVFLVVAERWFGRRLIDPSLCRKYFNIAISTGILVELTPLGITIVVDAARRSFTVRRNRLR